MLGASRATAQLAPDTVPRLLPTAAAQSGQLQRMITVAPVATHHGLVKLMVNGGYIIIIPLLYKVILLSSHPRACAGNQAGYCHGYKTRDKHCSTKGKVD